MNVFFLALVCLTYSQTFPHQEKHPASRSVLICPTGDVKQRGRTIHGSTEAAQTFACATALHDMLSNQHICNTFVSRAGGQTCEPLHNAQFANRMQVDVCIILSFFESLTPEPVIYLYHGVHDSKPTRSLKTFTFHPSSQAYVINRTSTITYSTYLYTALAKAPGPLAYTVHSPQGMRHQAVTGMVPPAIVIEIGLPTIDAWQPLVPSLVNAIHLLLNSIQGMRFL